MSQQYPSVLLEKAVGEFAKLPGIGRKTAMRLVLHLLRQDLQTVEAFGNAVITLKREVKYCRVCHNIRMFARFVPTHRGMLRRYAWWKTFVM